MFEVLNYVNVFVTLLYINNMDIAKQPFSIYDFYNDF